MENNPDNIDNIDNIDNQNNIEIINKKPDSKRSFSNNNVDDTHDFQSTHMIHKLKKIKKKKMKMKNNYNKIKEIDILTNNAPIQDDTENFTDNTTNDDQKLTTIQHIKQLLFGTEQIVEKFEDHEYEGIDKHKDMKRTKSKIHMTDKITQLYDYINSYNTYLAELLVGENKTYNKNSDARKTDIVLVRNSIVWLECAFVSSIMVYNWYFAIYFAKDIRNNIEIPSFSKDSLIEWSKDEKGNPGAFIGTFLYIFEFAFWFPEMLDWILLKIVPKTSGFLNGTCNFLLLYFVCLYCTKNFAISFKNFFVKLFTNPTGNMLINFMVLIVLILFFHSMFTLKSSGNPISDINNIISFMSPGGWVFTLLKFIFRFIITFLVSVPVGAIGCGLYLIYMSFFSRLTWGKWSISSVLFGMTSVNDIDKHIRSSKAGFEEIDLCNSNNLLALLYSFLSIIFTFLEYFKEHLLKIIYTIMLVIITVSLAINMSSLAPNKLPLNFFSAAISVASIVMVITSVIRHFELNKTNNSDSSSLGTTTQNPLNE